METLQQPSELLHLLRRCGHYLHRHWSSGRASQFRALRILEENGEITQRQLQDLMGIQQGSLSELVKKLEDQELITRACAFEDRRQLLIRVTKKGQKQGLEYQECQQNEAVELLGALSGEEQRQLYVLLDKLLDSWSCRQKGEQR